MRFPLVLVFLLLTASARPQHGIAATSLAADAEERWVPFEMTEGNQIRFAMTIDGKTLSAVLDTGVSYSAMSRAYAERTRVKVTPRGEADAIGGIVPVGWTPTRKLAFSSAKPSALASASGGAPSAGISTSSGTTARS